MQLSPKCHAISLGPGRTIAAEVFRHGAGAPPQPRYHHFHPAAELVWFRQASARMHVRGTVTPTGTGDLVYLPSMTPHDFDVDRGEREFVLILYDPRHEHALDPDLKAKLAEGPLILRPSGREAARINLLADWMIETRAPGCVAPRADSSAERILELILTVLATNGSPVARASDSPLPRPMARLEQAIELIHQDPARDLSLAQAAQICNLSPEYFARLFRDRMGVTFAEYRQRHRLNLAAQMIAASDLGIAEVAWKTGFGSPAHLSARFAEHFGLSPRRYRADVRRRGMYSEASLGIGQSGTIESTG